MNILNRFRIDKKILKTKKRDKLNNKKGFDDYI